jgi:hypothetical protein
MTLFMMIGYLVNIAVLPLMIGANFSNFLDSVGVVIEPDTTLGKFFKNKPSDINKIWYTVVGFQIASNIFMNFLMPNITEFGKAFFTGFKDGCIACCACCLISNQEELNEAYAGSKFRIYERYSFFLNHLGLCFIFAPSMPVLYLIGFAGVFLQYVVDR